MKKMILVLLASLFTPLVGCVPQPKTVNAHELLFGSVTGGQHLVWDYEDFKLDAQQVFALKATANNDALMLAARIVEARAANSPVPTSAPVALSCSYPSLIVVTSNALKQQYVDQGCITVRQI